MLNQRAAARSPVTLYVPPESHILKLFDHTQLAIVVGKVLTIWSKISPIFLGASKTDDHAQLDGNVERFQTTFVKRFARSPSSIRFRRLHSIREIPGKSPGDFVKISSRIFIYIFQDDDIL